MKKQKLPLKIEPKIKDQTPNSKLPNPVYFCSADFSDRRATRRFASGDAGQQLSFSQTGFDLFDLCRCYARAVCPRRFDKD